MKLPLSDAYPRRGERGFALKDSSVQICRDVRETLVSAGELRVIVSDLDALCMYCLDERTSSFISILVAQRG